MKEQIQKLIERMQELRSQLNRNAVLDNTNNLQSEYSDDLGQVCEILEDKLNLENEIADLKENAIIPKFKIGQEVWIIGFIENNYGIFQEPIKKIITATIQKNDGYDYCELNGEKNFYIDLEIYATKEEAQIALDKLNKE